MKMLHRNLSRAGFTLLETMLAVTMLALLTTALIENTTSMGRVTTLGNVNGLLQEQGERALDGVIAELRNSGYVSLAGVEFPYVFDDGDAVGAFAGHSHPPSDSVAEAGDPDFGVNSEVVFVLPADLDLDGRPDLDPVSGDLVWSAEHISFTLETQQDGRNHLMRRVNGAQERSVAHDVERIVFETWESSGFTIAPNTMRLRVFLRRMGENGVWYRHTCEVTLRLRNTG